MDVELFNVSTFLFLQRVVTPTKLRAEIHQDPIGMGVHRNSFKGVGETKTEKRYPKSCKDPLIIKRSNANSVTLNNTYLNIVKILF